MNCRLLSLDDYDRGYFELLSQLTIAPKVSFETFSNIFNKKPQNQYILVIEDPESQIIIGSGTILIEQKFIHGCSLIGHIEDVVVHKDYRKQGIGNILIQDLIEISKTLNCYKIILDCSLNNILFYEKCGLKRSESQNMVLYF